MKTLSKSSTVGLDQLLVKMLTENTGTHMLDSGGASGRGWQRNQGKTLATFHKAPTVTSDPDYPGNYTISLFHWLRRALELTLQCREFNRRFTPAADWDSEDFYGVSTAGASWIKERGFTVRETFNSYNGDSNLSQVIQGTWLRLDDADYLLLQIHGGCDVRGGYTDARLFFVPNRDNGSMCEDVYGTVTLKDGTQLDVDNRYDGVSLMVTDPNTGMPDDKWKDLPEDATYELGLGEVY